MSSLFKKACFCDNDAHLGPVGLSGLVVSVTHLLQFVIGLKKKEREKENPLFWLWAPLNLLEKTPDVINTFLLWITRLSRQWYLRPSSFWVQLGRRLQHKRSVARWKSAAAVGACQNWSGVYENKKMMRAAENLIVSLSTPGRLHTWTLLLLFFSSINNYNASFQPQIKWLVTSDIIIYSFFTNIPVLVKS